MKAACRATACTARMWAVYFLACMRLGGVRYTIQEAAAHQEVEAAAVERFRDVAGGGGDRVQVRQLADHGLKHAGLPRVRSRKGLQLSRRPSQP